MQPQLKFIEQAIDDHHLWVRVSTGRYWRCRRNGVTKRWKRDANRFRIPFKAGMFVFGEVTETTDIGSVSALTMFIISELDPNPVIDQMNRAWRQHKLEFQH